MIRWLKDWYARRRHNEPRIQGSFFGAQCLLFGGFFMGLGLTNLSQWEGILAVLLGVGVCYVGGLRFKRIA